MIEINNHDHGIIIALSSGTRYERGFDHVITSVGNGGVLRGGVVYKNYTGSSVVAHFAGFIPAWITRDFLLSCFDYAFSQLDCRVMVGETPSYNIKALALVRRLGLKEVARVPDFFTDGDLVISALKRQECRWVTTLEKSPNE